MAGFASPWNYRQRHTPTASRPSRWMADISKTTEIRDRMTIQRMDNVGIVVEDLPATIAFFRELGLELEGRAMVEGEWAGRVTGLGDQRVEIAMMRTPDGHVVEQSGRDRRQRTANWCLSGPAPRRLMPRR